jgi:hypothetical protein
MMPPSAVLPDLDALDAERLKALVVEKHALVIEKEAELASQHDEIERLKLFIAKLQRMQFGPSSERLARHIDQWNYSSKTWKRIRQRKHPGRSHPRLLQRRRLESRYHRSCRVKRKRFDLRQQGARIVEVR